MEDPKTPSAPHECVDCGAPCYIPFGLSPLCTNRQCQHYQEDCWVKHVLELPDQTCGEGGEEFEIEDEEPTVPDGGWLKMPGLGAPKTIKNLTYQPKVKGGGKLNLPTWDDLVQEYLDGDTSDTTKLYHAASSGSHLQQIAEIRRDWYRINADPDQGLSLTDYLFGIDNE